jgi:hypothetical protein
MTRTATTFPPTLGLLLGLMLLGSSPCTAAAAPEGGRRAPVEKPVAMTIADLGQGGYSVRGDFGVEAPPCLVWAVLSDYGRIGEFVSSVRRSVIIERGPDHVVVEQEGSGKVFVFSKRVHVTLHVTEEPPHAIAFRDVSGRDFSAYDGRWEISEQGGATHVSYVLNATLRSRKPGFLVRGGMEGSARELLEQVRTEILRRAAAPRTTPAS